jgi:SAM-dependent methyltransferase
METHTSSVAAHYEQNDLFDAITKALRCAGKDLDALTIDDLSAIDEVHTRGREATVEVADLVMFTPELNVLDVGSGVGGPARYIARTFGCRVTGIDLTPAFCDAATKLTELVDLQDLVSFQVGSALDMPFDNASYDLVWTIQMQMNIADKPALYREMARVLRPGGCLVFQDIVAGVGGPIHTPVPWASEPGQSFLAMPDDLRAMIASAGFEELTWRDSSDAHRASYEQADRKGAARKAKGAPKPSGPPPLGIHLVLGPGTVEKRANTKRNLMEDRIGYVQGLYRKPD